MSLPSLRLLIGPTASGKSSVAHEIARRERAEILSVDSMKIYRGLDIGVAKPTVRERAEVVYHLIDWKEHWEGCSVAEWLGNAERIILRAHESGVPILAEGGTTMFIRTLREGLFPGPGRDHNLRRRLEEEAVRDGLAVLFQRLQEVDPRAAQRILPGDQKRIVRALEVFELTGKTISEQQIQWGHLRTDLVSRVVGFRMDRKMLYRRIDDRVAKMLDSGWVEECRFLLNLERPLSLEAEKALGYRTLFAHLRGEISLAEARERICFDTHHFARRQLNWFRKFPDVQWIDLDENQDASALADQVQVLWLER